MINAAPAKIGSATFRKGLATVARRVAHEWQVRTDPDWQPQKVAGNAPLIFALHPTRRWAHPLNPLILMSGIALAASIPPSACIPAPAPCCDLITARVYACVVGQGGQTHGQQTEAE